MEYGFIKSACITPNVKLADTKANADIIIAELEKAAEQGIQLVVFPELCITGYTCSDLFLQQSLRTGALLALSRIAFATQNKNLIAVVGLPVEVSGKLYNCAAAVAGGEVLGIVPKTFLPNYSEFYEMRHFASAAELGDDVISIPVPDASAIIGPINHTPGGSYFATVPVPFGTKLLFECTTVPAFTLGLEICEDLWSPLPPSTEAALAGATIIANTSASNETVGKAEYRRQLVENQSGRLLCGYLYCSAGFGESTQDMTFASHSIIAENGSVLTERKPFTADDCVTELDVNRLVLERSKNTSFHSKGLAEYNYIPFELDLQSNPLTRSISTTPFVPASKDKRAERCELIFNMQSRGLASRLDFTHAKTAVIGISGGLDSCLALLVAVRAMKEIGRPASDVLAITMPCFGTTKRTRTNAEILCDKLGVTFQEINITDTVRSHFADIGQDEAVTDVTYENGQARVRTLELMDIANKTGGLVVGTGDLSELALGWATYNGDHMSMYGVNAGVPKTLVRHMVQYAADVAAAEGQTELSQVLINILETPVSPELIPPKDGEISQQTEELVGPYELHDFFLYYVLRFGFGPQKIYHLALTAFAGREEYTPEIILKWLRNFYRRFFAQQFKRSCLPDGPKIGSVTLSPRGDWRMPTDAYARIFLDELDELESKML